MSEDSFDPAVVALLQEIAADPRASLLRIPKERLIRWVGRPEEVVKPSGSYLTKAEKHLVAAYREEAAWVLLQGCVVELKKQPLVFSTMVPDRERLRNGAQRLAKSKVLPDAIRQITRDLANGLTLDAVQLSSSALRLAPSDHARNCLAIAFQRQGLNVSSMRLLRQLLAGEPSADQRAQAFENIAQLWARRGAFERVLANNKKAVIADENKVRLLVWCLTSALQAGDSKSAREHAMRIQEHPRRREVASISESLHSARSRLDWSPTAAGQGLAAKLVDRLPETAWSVCHAFL